MKKSELADEVLALKQAVDTLQKQAKPRPLSKKSSKKTTATVNESLEAEAKKILSDLLVHAKKDYEHLSPVTALLIFALGVALGGSIGRGHGGKS